MTDIVEVANKLYNRNYLSFSRGMCQFGEVLTFKGTGGELTILESEMQFHLKRKEEQDAKLKKMIDGAFKDYVEPEYFDNGRLVKVTTIGDKNNRGWVAIMPTKQFQDAMVKAAGKQFGGGSTI